MQVLGVDDAFWKLSPSGKTNAESKTGNAEAHSELAINEALARRLNLKVGDTIVIRLEKPSAISRDAPLSGEASQDVTLRRTISAIVAPEDFGSFQLSAAQTAPLNVFVPLTELSEALGKKDRVNGMLLGTAKWPQKNTMETEDEIRANATGANPQDLAPSLEDFALKLLRVPAETNPQSQEWQLSTDRIFLDEAIASKLLKAMPQSYGALTYMVNGFSSAKGKTAYSFVTAVDESRRSVPPLSETDKGRKAPSTFISQWLADDLSVLVGDKIQMRYFTVGIGREMKEQTADFTVSGILPMTDPRLNPSWTPDFPGVTDSKNCRDWQPGIPMKLDTIRKKDEDYWQQYKATPKAFISLADGQKLWANRFGKLTAIRFPESGNAESGMRKGEAATPKSAVQNPQSEAALRREIVSHLKLSDIGLIPRDFRAEAAAAAQGSVDFGGLFVGLSLFLIAAALVFAALLFLFTLEQRASQIGLMLALGFTTKQVRRVVLGEAGVVALLGAALGIGGGILYTKAALAGLNGVWSGATVGLRLVYDAQPMTLGIAFAASVLASLGTLWWASRRIFKGRAKDLLAGEAWTQRSSEFGVRSSELERQGKGFSMWRWASRVWHLTFPFLPALCLISAVGMSFAGSKATDPEEIAGMFFGAGFMLLAAGLLIISRRIKKVEQGTHTATNLVQIGALNITRRPGRSLAVIGMMAGGIFLVIAVNAFRLGAEADPAARSSGTGGFALIGESTLPIYEDLNTQAAWDAFALDDKIMKPVRVVPFRVRDGDDASCLNLNKAQRPMLCAVDAAKLAERKAFTFTEGDWDKLSEGIKAKNPSATSSLPIPAIADQATAMWGLGKGVGDTIAYTDAQGREFNVKLVGLLAGSVLQGKVIINEAAFLEKYPDAAGYKFFLVDAAEGKSQEAAGRSGDEKSAIRNPQSAIETVRAHLTRQLEQRGLALEKTTDRLAAFSEVQNTYIGIFTVLGGLGVLLGTAGLGVLALRNVLERRGEFGLMQALGFRARALRGMVLVEHVALLVGGLVLGLISAAIAVWPNIRQSGGALPFSFLFWLNAGILAFGVVVCWLAARLALRGRLLDAIRRE